MDNAGKVELLKDAECQEFETALGAAVQRHHEEELEMIRKKLASIVRKCIPQVR